MSGFRFEISSVSKFVRLPRSRLTKPSPIQVVRGLEDVPRSNILRYVAWRMARNVMPTAGRITSVDAKHATISLGRSTGITPGASFA